MAPKRLSSPIRLGPFVLIEPIGKGGMGEVWSGVHIRQRVPVAIKVIPGDQANSPAFLQAFEQEVQAVARLNHPGIIMVFDYGTIPQSTAIASEGRLQAGKPYLVMERASGGTLSAKPGGQIHDWESLRDALLSVLDSLGHAHARGVIHRDVKPANVLVCTGQDSRPGLKLTDFGLAAAGDSQETSRRAGTPAYMAPEQCSGHWREHGPWTDLYSLGCMAYALCTGKVPFDDSNPMQVILYQWSQDPPPLESRFPVPRAFEWWVRRLMAKSPNERYRWAADAAHDLRGMRTPGAGSSLSLFVSSRPELSSSWRKTPGRGTPVVQGHASIKLTGVGLGLYGLRTVPLIGRAEMLDQLWGNLRAVYQSRRAHVRLLHGEPGTGKSRLTEAFAQRAHEMGAAKVLRATHSATVAGPSEGIPRMLAMSMRCLGLKRDEVLKRMRKLLGSGPDDYTADSWTELLSPATPEDIARGARVIRFSNPTERHVAARQMLEYIARERPVILCLDDVHWGLDTLRFVAHMLKSQEQSPSAVLLLLVARDDALLEHPLARDELEALMVDDFAEPIPVTPMPPHDHAALVRELLGLEGELAAEVEARTAGNPLFAVQLVGDWVERGVLEIGETGFRLRRGEKAELPNDIHELWTARLVRVLEPFEGETLAALELAATLGIEVQEREWSTACLLASMQVSSDLLPAMINRGLARAVDEGWAFCHEMFRESIERSAREAGRWQDHNRHCADMIMQLYPEHQRGRAERIGRHLLGAQEQVRALPFLLQGASERYETSDYRVTLALLDMYEEALRAIDRPHQHEDWARGQIVRCDTFRQLGYLDRSNGLAHRLEISARQLEAQSPHLLIEVLAARGHIAKERGDFDAATLHYNEALVRCEQHDYPRLRADCLWGLGVIALSTSAFDRARQLLLETKGVASSIDYQVCVADVNYQLGGIARKLGQFDVATEHVQAAREAYEQFGTRVGLSNSLNGLAELHRAQGNLEAAEQGYRQALAIQEAIGATHRVCRANLALVLLEREQYEEAERRLEVIREELQSLNALALLGVINVVLLPCVAMAGDWERFERYHAEALDLLKRTSVVDPDVAWPAQRAGVIASEKGQQALAIATLELALRQWEVLQNHERVAEVKALIEAATEASNATP